MAHVDPDRLMLSTGGLLGLWMAGHFVVIPIKSPGSVLYSFGDPVC